MCGYATTASSTTLGVQLGNWMAHAAQHRQGTRHSLMTRSRTQALPRSAAAMGTASLSILAAVLALTVLAPTAEGHTWLFTR